MAWRTDENMSEELNRWRIIMEKELGEGLLYVWVDRRK